MRACCNDECGWQGETDRMCGAIGPVCPSCGDTTEPLSIRRIDEKWLADEHGHLLFLLVEWSAKPLHTNARIEAWNAVEKYLTEHLK